MSVITQRGDSALIRAAINGQTEVVVELMKAKANLDIQNEVLSRLTVTIHCICTFVYIHVHTHML